MFDFVRTHSRLTLAFLLLLIIPSFVFFGIEGYTRFTSGAAETVAKVSGQSVTRAEWDQVHQRLVDRVRRQQPGLDVAVLDTPQARRETLDVLLRERTLMAAARDMHLAPSDARLQRLFVSDPGFAGLRNPDGSVNRELLQLQGMNSEMFAQQLRQEFAMRQVLAGVEQSALAPASVAARSLDALLERREVQLQRFDPAAYRNKVNPSDGDLEAYYKANEAQFRTPESAQIEYVTLDFAALGKGIAVSDDEARQFYQQNAARFTAPEERRASHILIKAEQGASSEVRAKAKARAEALLAEARKNPAAFAELARKNSEDPGSAANGGDLDFFARGAMVKAFEEATWALKKGEISNVIESDFGYHVILLTDVRGGQSKPFDQVRGEILDELRKSRLTKTWPEAAEQFTNMAYEQPDSLQPLIDKWKLDKQTASVQRKPPPGATGVLASTKLLDALFAADALRNKRNTDAIEIGPNQLVAARVVTHQPTRVPPLSEVKEQVRERVLAEQASALARKEGEARLAALRGKPDEALKDTITLSRAVTLGAPRELVDVVMRADPSMLPLVTGVDLGAMGYVVLKVTRILPREAAPGGDDSLRAQYAQAWGGAESAAYLAALKKRYKVEVTAAARAASAPN
jgi:peptidyl-prolyl cis-trans isomerase D